MKKLLLNIALLLLLQSRRVTADSAPLNQANLDSCLDSCHPEDCFDLYAQGLTADGVYLIYPGGVGSPPVPVYCDMTSSGGPWTVFQKRFDGSENFYRGWKQYVNGFGRADGEYWLGLRIVQLLTQKRLYQLQVRVVDMNNEARHGTYNTFSLSPTAVDPESDGYKLHIGPFREGNPNKPIGDALRAQEKMCFSTFDNDRDTYADNCAVIFQGAYWYSDCHKSNLNGLYLKGTTDKFGKGITWSTWNGQNYSMKESEMKIGRNIPSQ